jgi:D,D-heptose 1,7-bisphosphate phosphatase
VKVFVLNGGKGTRLGLTDRPKPMVPVAGQPLIERLVLMARDCGFTDFVFLNGHLGEVIEAHFGDGSAFGVSIEHVRERQALGTAGAFREVRHLADGPFLVLYGDVLLDVDLAHFAAFHAEKGGLGSLYVHPNDHPYDSDLVEADDDARIVCFHSKPHPQGVILPNLVSGALYVLDPRAIDFVPADGVSDWGKDVFPAIVAAGEQLNAYRSIEYGKDVGTPDRLAKGEADLTSGRTARLSRRTPKPAIFLDRDGVLNREIDGVHAPDKLELLPGVGDAVRRINRAGVPAICVTNQPDIAKGFMTFADLRTVLAALDTRLAESGAYLDDFYYCPHHPERGFAGEVAALKIDCDCRKPKPGMLLKAAEAHNIDLARSWMVGDRYVDIDAGRAAGTRTILVRTGHAGSDRTPTSPTPDHIADDLPAAVAYILQELA